MTDDADEDEEARRSARERRQDGDAGDGIARYEPAIAGRDSSAQSRVAGGLGYSVEEHEVVLVGACADCS
jgi:hypothetical protein